METPHLGRGLDSILGRGGEHVQPLLDGVALGVRELLVCLRELWDDGDAIGHGGTPL
jgi:hypothetical protein